MKTHFMIVSERQRGVEKHCLSISADEAMRYPCLRRLIVGFSCTSHCFSSALLCVCWSANQYSERKIVVLIVKQHCFIGKTGGPPTEVSTLPCFRSLSGLSSCPYQRMCLYHSGSHLLQGSYSPFLTRLAQNPLLYIKLSFRKKFFSSLHILLTVMITEIDYC